VYPAWPKTSPLSAASPMTMREISDRRQRARTYHGWPSPPDPGDLSKRLAHRRAELRLSRAQVAVRARISLRYLEYLESFPSVPDALTLRQLAAALRTTPAALLGAGAQAPPGRAGAPAHPVITKLFAAECRRLIEPGGVGRIAFSTAAGPVVLPVNFVVLGGTIVLRTAAGTVIGAHGDDVVAFEVDHIDEALGQGWSVLVRGQAHRVLQPGELRHVRETADVVPWADGTRETYVRIVPSQITGRRIEAA
jgi:nitroimidazol reductase NimA-like FMN-containing flavoprotein (pyridoxamine 5'-phosphate oxidase superfamily)